MLRSELLRGYEAMIGNIQNVHDQLKTIEDKANKIIKALES